MQLTPITPSPHHNPVAGFAHQLPVGSGKHRHIIARVEPTEANLSEMKRLETRVNTLVEEMHTEHGKRMAELDQREAELDEDLLYFNTALRAIMEWTADLLFAERVGHKLELARVKREATAQAKIEAQQAIDQAKQEAEIARYNFDLIWTENINLRAKLEAALKASKPKAGKHKTKAFEQYKED